jgi:hypothetical protein
LGCPDIGEDLLEFLEYLGAMVGGRLKEIHSEYWIILSNGEADYIIMNNG